MAGSPDGIAGRPSHIIDRSMSCVTPEYFRGERDFPRSRIRLRRRPGSMGGTSWCGHRRGRTRPGWISAGRIGLTLQ